MSELDLRSSALLENRPGLRSLLAVPFVGLALRVGSLLVAYLLLERWLLGVARLTPASYEEPIIAVEVIRGFLVRPRLSLSYGLRIGLLCGLAVLVVGFPSRIRARWAELDEGEVLRVLVAAPTIVLAWAFATYDYNLYFDQAHLFDRVALLALAALVLWRPVFVRPFAVSAVSIVWQFNYPVTPYSVAEQFLLVRVLLLFFVFFLAHVVRTGHRPSDFVFLVFTLLAASYFSGGLGKLRLDWFTLGNVALLLPATYANGWLGFLEPATIGRLTRGLLSVDWMMVAATFAVECGAILCFVRRRVFLSFLGAWVVFHLAIVALSGIFFWKWVVVELMVLTLMLSRRVSPAFNVFSKPHALLSVPFIIGGLVWFNPVDLSWYNAAVSYTYRFEAIDESGRRFPLAPSFFAPYDYQFTQSGFSYLSDRRQLRVMWGATWNRDDAAALAAAREPPEVAALEEARGELFRDDARTEQLDGFIRRFVGNFNARGSKRTLFSVLQAPPQLWTFPRRDPFGGGEPIRFVVVRQVTSFFDGTDYHELSSRLLHTIEIPSTAMDPP